MAKIGKKLTEIIDQVVDNILDSPEVDKAIDEVETFIRVEMGEEVKCKKRK